MRFELDSRSSYNSELNGCEKKSNVKQTANAKRCDIYVAMRV